MRLPIWKVFWNKQVFLPRSTYSKDGIAHARAQDNFAANDTLKINRSANLIFGAMAVYNATITHTNGTAATISAFIFQDTNGYTYLAPETEYDVDRTAFEAKPVTSLHLDSDVADFGAMCTSCDAADYANPLNGV